MTWFRPRFEPYTFPTISSFTLVRVLQMYQHFITEALLSKFEDFYETLYFGNDISKYIRNSNCPENQRRATGGLHAPILISSFFTRSNQIRITLISTKWKISFLPKSVNNINKTMSGLYLHWFPIGWYRENVSRLSLFKR